MAAIVGKYAANKVLGSQMKKYQNKMVSGGDDPFFALIEDPKRPGKMKKVKKVIPAYIPEHDAMVLASVKKTAYRLDMCLFNLFGMRFGWESVIGIIPGFGDVVGVLLALSVWRKCQKVEGGLDSGTNTQMLLNIIIDFAVGLIPFLGDLADAAFKANTRNAALLERQLDKKYRPGGRDPRDVAGLDREKRQQNRKSGIYHPQDPPPATVFEDFDDETEDRRQFMREQDATDRVRQPERTRAPTQQPQQQRRGGGGWLSKLTGGNAQSADSGRQQAGNVRR
ncbi:hypothetical protein LTR95_015680 [Oleoguttula sp. CCFEE 5521]